MSGYSAELRELLQEFCTIGDIHSLLKTAEGNGAVKLTAPNKTTMIEKNLREALEAKALSIDHVHDLIRDAEENGHQDIFYYQPASKAVKNLPITDVGKRLWGKDWEEKMKFPTFKLALNKFTYADLRPWNPTKKPLDWVLKIYGQQMFEEQSGGDEKIDEQTILRTFILQPRRLVLVVRWNSPDVLEIRVPQSSSKQRVHGWLDQAWEMAQPVFGSDEFTPWDLCGARRAIVTSQSDNEKLYRFSHSRLEDTEHNMISYSAAHADRSLGASSSVVKSMQGMVKPGVTECKYLRVTWIPDVNGMPADELVSYLGDRAVNQMGIGRRCSRREIDYVTEQLRSFSK